MPKLLFEEGSERAREIGRKGGLASAEARRIKRAQQASSETHTKPWKPTYGKIAP